MKNRVTFVIKYDFLLTNGISLLQLCIEMLCEKGYMEWQGTLRDTYIKYLLPENIDMEDERIWDLICQGKLMNIFQFETPVNIADHSGDIMVKPL